MTETSLGLEAIGGVTEFERFHDDRNADADRLLDIDDDPRKLGNAPDEKVLAALKERFGSDVNQRLRREQPIFRNAVLREMRS